MAYNQKLIAISQENKVRYISTRLNRGILSQSEITKNILKSNMNSIPTECPQFNMPNIQTILKLIDLSIEKKQNFVYQVKEQLQSKGTVRNIYRCIY